jgi:hypothetical protein
LLLSWENPFALLKGQQNCSWDGGQFSHFMLAVVRSLP